MKWRDPKRSTLKHVVHAVCWVPVIVPVLPVLALAYVCVRDLVVVSLSMTTLEVIRVAGPKVLIILGAAAIVSLAYYLLCGYEKLIRWSKGE